MSTPALKIGLWGGQEGSYHNISAAPQRLTKITIRSGWAIDAISFCYVDINGNERIAGQWGGNGGDHHEIILGAGEYVRGVSGTHGYCQPADNVITSLHIVTNMTRYSFGRTKGNTFSLTLENGQVVGFHARSGMFVDAIGVYVRNRN